MASRLLTFAVWALVAGSGFFWGLKLFVRPTGLPASAQATQQVVPQSGELTRVLGAVAEVETDDEPEPGSDRFKLLGVVAPGPASRAEGVALIAVGDQPAKAWRTGATVDGDTVLLSVSKRSAKLGPRGGPASTELTLPEPSVATNAARPVASIAQPHMPGQPQLPQTRVMPVQQPQQQPPAPQHNGVDEDEE